MRIFVFALVLYSGATAVDAFAKEPSPAAPRPPTVEKVDEVLALRLRTANLELRLAEEAIEQARLLVALREAEAASKRAAARDARGALCRAQKLDCEAGDDFDPETLVVKRRPRPPRK